MNSTNVDIITLIYNYKCDFPNKPDPPYIAYCNIITTIDVC